MPNKTDPDFMYQPVTALARKDFITLKQGLTVQEALNHIRSEELNEMIIYFYVVDEHQCLVGVVPTRRLLTAPMDMRISEVMIHRVIKLASDQTILDAHELMAGHKLLALPMVDQEGKMTGVIDISMFSDLHFEVESRPQVDEVFESIGFRIAQIKDASIFRVFRYRFPWLTATIASGTICALLTSVFELTLAQSLVLAFFLTLVLGLGESVSMQTMTVTIQSLRNLQPTMRWYWQTFRRELGMGVLLGAACGMAVGLIVVVWHDAGWVAITIGASIMLVMVAACLYGLSIPSILHALKLDPKIAAGPMTLAITDISTILIYFSMAALLL